jgi:matrixin
MKKLFARLAGILCALALAGTSSAYYYYVHFNTTSGPFLPILEKYDLSVLQNNTVPFFISDAGPSEIYPGDTFQAIISEVRAAANIWNSVSTSKVRLGYTGLFSAGTDESAPGIDVEFSDDIPPGLLALGGPRVPGGATGSVTMAVGGPFVPILRSKLLLHSDMSQIPSFSEAFFVTLVHEFGHTLGLQHTLTSSVMSTLVTSASSKASPLGADDIAGISQLYPTDGYLSTVGTVSGRVTAKGKGVNMASVVAIAPGTQPISTLTNPDGTYQLVGLAPNVSYYIYVHPLPPPLQGENSPANIAPPLDPKGNSDAFQPNQGFATQFYTGNPGGTRDWTKAQQIAVDAGDTATGINFNVSSRGSVAVYAVRTYGYSPTNIAEASPPVNILYPASLVASGAGLLENGKQLSNGLAVSELGASAVVYNLQPYTSSYLLMAVQVYSGLGPAHMLFSTPNDLYVLPTAFKAVNTFPPGITSVTASVDKAGNGVAVVAGTNLSKNTRILFDGLPATIQNITKDGKLIVLPPQAPLGYVASVAALNPDGQSSLFLQGDNVSTFTYGANGTAQASPSLAVTPGTLPTGRDIVVDVVGKRTNFIDGQTVVGFGTSDVLVKKVTVLSPTHLTVLVNANVSWSTYTISITTGLNVISQSQGARVGSDTSQ